MKRSRKIAVLALLALAAVPGTAQLPGVRLPALPLGGIADPLVEQVERVPKRLEAATSLLRAHPRELEVGPRGEVAVRGEILVVAPSASGLEPAYSAGFALISDNTDAALGLHLVVLRPPPGANLQRAIEQLRRLDPDGTYDVNSLYAPGGREIGAVLASAAPQDAPSARIGIIDSGVAAAHPAFSAARIEIRGFAGDPVPAAHGTAVASLLVGAAGVARGAQLLAADVYGGGPTGGNARAIVAACGWLARADVGVVNFSIVGPPNAALQAAVEALQSRGVIVVAAVGNDGPAGAPLYPAAYPKVVAVTALDSRGRLLPEAGAANHTDFAAPGIVRVAAAPGGYTTVRGTSFATPFVAGALARRHPVANRVDAEDAVLSLARDGKAQRRR